MIELRSFDSLGKANFGWLNANHHFSFGHYRDAGRMNWGRLRVWNDDEIAYFEQGIFGRVEAAGLDVDHHWQKAAKAAREIRDDGVHCDAKRQRRRSLARIGTTTSPPKA